jgi:hypothetical protein
MTILRENFRPVGDVLPISRRDFPLADPTLASPDSAVVLTDGEWMTLDSTYKLVRATDITDAATPAEPSAGSLIFPLWAEQGRYDIQAMADHKCPILWMGGWEFETRVFDASAVAGTGAAITTLFQGLKVATITIGSRNYTGLVGYGGAGDTGALVVGYVTKLPSDNGGWLRLRGGFGW